MVPATSPTGQPAPRSETALPLTGTGAALPAELPGAALPFDASASRSGPWATATPALGPTASPAPSSTTSPAGAKFPSHPSTSPTDSSPGRPAANPAFSPTTTLRLNVNAALGGLGYGGSAVDGSANQALGLPLLNAVSFNHDTRLTLDTSLSGQDLFRLRLRSGNFGGSGFFSNPPTPLTRLDFAFEEPACTASAPFCGRDGLTVNRAYLEWPIGDSLRLSLGPRVMQVDLLPVWPSAYTASPILELFQRAGAAGAYSRRVGAGLGLAWQPRGRWRGLSLAVATVAPEGGNGSPEEGGLFTGVGGQTSTLQLAYSRSGWNLTATYTLTAQAALLRGTPLASQLAAQAREGALQSWGLAGYWQPDRGGWIPSISLGWGQDSFGFARWPLPGLTGVTTSSWSLGLQWSDVFGAGNTVMLALGGPAQVTALWGLAGPAPDDGALALELAGRIRVSDNLSLTPALFWLPRPRGAMAGTTSISGALLPGPGAAAPSLSVWGVVLRSTLRF
ncbi:MAG: hypothetical protein ACK5N0_01860 [Synechococcaceae cyanobacterium]